MILDSRTEFCDAVALNTGAAGTYNVGDLIDTQVARNLGQKMIYLTILVQTTATSGGSATAQFQLVSDSTSTISTTTQSVHFVSAAIPVATLVAGYKAVEVAIPLEGVAYERYLGIQQITAVAAFTAGKIDAFLSPGIAAWKSLPDGAN